MLNRRSFVVCFLCLLYSCQATAEVNLALYRKYTLHPKPNYKHCTDIWDITQLTDGRTFGSTWTNKDTVGWKAASTGIEIVIDLNKISTIDKVRLSSVGGGRASVEFPEFIAVLVSEDGVRYDFAGLAGSEQLPTGDFFGGKRVPHTFVIDNLNTEARFVKIVVRPRNHYFFLDEIEVIRSKQESDQKIVRRKNLLDLSNSEELLETIEDYLQLRKNILATIKALHNNRGKFSYSLPEKVSSELDSLAELFKLPNNKIYLKNELLLFRKRLGLVRAQIYRDFYNKPFVCFVANPMEFMLEKDMPLVDIAEREWLDIQLWQQEYESAAVNIINCSQEPLEVVVSISQLASKEGISVESHRTFTIRRAVLVKAMGLGSIADALVLQSEKPFQLQPGQIVQIWLTVFNPTLTASDYKGTFVVSASSARKKLPANTIPINLRIDKITFPLDVALNTCTWDEYTPISSVTKNILPTVAEDLRSHHVNISVIHTSIIPFPKRVSPGDAFLRGVDFTKLDKMLENNNFARMYLLYFNWNTDFRFLFGEWMSSDWKNAFSVWLKMLVDHLHKAGIGYERFALYPFDESLCDEFYQTAKMIKEIDPKINIFANWFGKGPQDFMRFKDLVDIWCLPGVKCDTHPDWFSTIKSFGKEVWAYGGTLGSATKGPAKTRIPYDYFRLTAWHVFRRGQTGTGFWVYLPYTELKWNDTMRVHGYYAVIYGAADSLVDTQGERIIPSRRWEAWREGTEDYQYLHNLKEAIESTKIKNPRLADEAQEVLNAQVSYVLKHPDDCDAVYQARQALTEMLLRLGDI